MRHGTAEEQSPTGNDFDRALTPRGKEKVRRIGAQLLVHGEVPLRIVASPLLRTQQTAEVLASSLGHSGPVDFAPELAPAGKAEPYVRKLLASHAEGILLIGHEPNLSQLAGQLLGSFPRTFDKATVLGLALSVEGAATLRFTLDPHDLQLIFS